MNTLKRIWKWIGSMQFAIGLLVLLAVACSIGSFVTQGQSFDWYAARYNERTAAIIMALHLDDAFHSWWFLAINVFLCVNLLLCNVVRLKPLIRRTKAETQIDLPGENTVRADGVNEPEAFFARLHMPKPVRGAAPDGTEVLVSSKNRIGLWGAWVCHLGILLLILGFSLGQMTHKEYVAYGVPGQTRPIGDTGLWLTIDDFQIGLREDDTVEQYTADITVFRAPQGSTSAPDTRSATVSVNHPAKLFGMTFYQNSTGWAATVSVTKNGEPLQSEVVCAGDYLRIADMPNLVVYLNAFYPDYVSMPGSRPMTASGQLNNPAYLYSVYYGSDILGMNVLMPDESVTIDEYEVKFSDPQTYTLIQIKRDAYTWLAFLGGVVTMLGLVLAFYLLPVKVWAVRKEDGTWVVAGRSQKGGAIFAERFQSAAIDSEQKSA